MRRVVLAMVIAAAILGVFAAQGAAAPIPPYTTNTACLECHAVAGGVGAFTKVDFTSTVDYSKCVRCHWVTVGPSFGFSHEKVVYVPQCSECHQSQDATARWAGEFSTPFGYFAGPGSLSKSSAEVHAAHINGSWPLTVWGSYCRSCHGAVGCDMCHSTPTGHGRHVADSDPLLPEYAPVTYLTSFGSTPTVNTRYEQNYFSTTVSCVASACHPRATLTTTPKPACGSCHPTKTTPHGYSEVDHVADDGVEAGVACSACHALDLSTEHAKATSSTSGEECAACHPTPRDTLGAWDQSCVTGGCHTPSSTAPKHAGAASAHAVVPAGEVCLDCHDGTDLGTIHAAADDGAGNTSCFVCHSTSGAPATSDCTVCHFTMDAHPGGVHGAPASVSCAGAGCHDIVDVRTNHVDAPEGACSVCHRNPAVPVLPADSECANCHAVQGGVPHYEAHAADPALVSGGAPNYAFYTGSAPGGFFTTACATCHTSNLIDAHIGSAAVLSQKDRLGNPLTCDSCHDSTDPDVVLSIAGGITKCDACHENPMTGGPGVHGPINPTHTSTFKTSPEVPCSPCHAPNVVDEHNGSRSWPDANGTQLAYCDVCHSNYAGARGQQVQDAIEVTNDVRCTACHSAAHPELGSHTAASSASVQGCGLCHAPGAATIDVRSMHAGSPLGPCAVCHQNPARVPDITAKTAECASCHASEGADHHRGLPGKHVYSGMPATCLSSTCHSSNSLPEAHDPYLSRYPSYTTTCALCHANTTPGRIPADATASCDSCHAPIHPDMDHEADDSGECVDCHETADALTLHAEAVGGPCDVCHANPSRVPALPDSVECVDCHAYSPPAANHYPATKHVATSMGRIVSAGGSASATCGSCHAASLPTAHGSMSDSFYGSSLSCVECHTDTRSNGKVQVLAGWATDLCDDCHTTGSKIMHSATNAPPVAAVASTSCASSGAGCHAGSDLHQLHRSASGGCNLSGCHTTPNVKPVDKSCGSGGACHVTIDETTHYVASPTHTADVTAVYTYAGKSNACSACHSGELKLAHREMPESKCLNCHNSTDPDSVAVIKGTTAWNRSCLACHTVYHAQVASDHAGQPPAGDTCLGTGCHTKNSTDLVAVHSGLVNSCGIAGCHDAANKDRRPPAKACATCHPDKTDEHGDHSFTVASDYSAGTGTGCTNSGSGCHGGDTVYDARAYHVGCTGCHSSPSYAGYAAPDFDCARCHDGDYSGAPDTIALAGKAPNGHYGETTHTAMQMTREVSAGGTAKAACGVCHDTSLYPVHGSMSASFYGPSLSCYECHNDTRSNGNAQVFAGWTTDRCDDCHMTGSKVMHSAVTAPVVAATTSAGCGNGTGCHSLTDLHALHRNASSCALAGCHDVKNVMPAKRSCGVGGACHATMSGNHQAEHDTQGVIDAGCYGCHFRYLTDEHAALGYSCSTCHASTNSIVQGAIAANDRRCLTCHPDSAHNARQAAEFAPGNASLHRVRADLPGMRSSFVVNGTTYTWTLPTASSFLKSGFAYDTIVTCDSCHTYTDVSGPHGATMKVNIDPAYPNPYKVVNGSETFTAQLSKNSSTGMSMTKGGSSAAKIICEKCHDLNGTGSNFSNKAHDEHDDRGREGAFCNQCHVAIPHGWGRPRLIGYTSDASPYRTWVGTSGAKDGGLARISIKSYTPSLWDKQDCGAGCSSSRHPLTGSSWPNQMALPPSQSGTVSGKVTDAATSANISGATVSLSNGASTTTASDGTYSIAGLAGGTYTMTVSKSGYTTWSGPVTITVGTTTTQNVALTAAVTATNWARTGTASASSTDGSNSPSRAIDGSTSTYWRSSSGGTQWLRVDLGSSKSVSKVVVNWNGSYYAKAYRIETSSDGSTWTSRYSTSSGTSGTKTHTFTAVDARYVRVYCTSANSGHYRINELEVWNF